VGVSSRSTQIDEVVDRLFAPLTISQQRVVDVTAEVFFTKDLWPMFQYVEATLDTARLDAKAVLGTLPISPGVIRYGAFRRLDTLSTLGEQERIQLTLLGLHHYQGPFAAKRDALVRDVLRLLQVFIDARRAFRPSATEFTPFELTSQVALDALAQLRSPHSLPAPSVLASLVEGEPPFSTSLAGWSGDPTRSSFTWSIGRQVLVHDPVGLDLRRYVEAIVDRYHVPPSVTRRAVPSPLSLAASLGYLDTAWRVLHGRGTHLVELPGPERTISLALDCATREEFVDRIGALGDLLKNLRVPSGGQQKGGHALERLRAYLTWKLPPESQETLAGALDQLDHIRVIRNATGHEAAESDGARAYRALGISFPVTDWPGAWRSIQAEATVAFDSVRGEVMSFVESPPE
jgi:hypothetical protein